MAEQAQSNPAAPVASADRVDDLAQIIAAYNQVTDKLRQNHETLQAEVVRLRQELASTNAQLQRSKRLSALGEMAAGIAHEIRNPLAAIQLYASMVVEDLDGPALRSDLAIENTRKISAAVHGLNGIVNDVLSFAREIEPRRVPVAVTELFDRVIEAHLPAIDQNHVTVVRHDTQRDTLWVQADASLLHQAMLNLVRNAVEALAQLPERRELILDVRLDQDQAVALVVRDTGAGIEDDQVDRIFNPFYTTRNTGTGLGLAIVHRIVDAHGGAIVVRNDGGAVFEVHLPLATAPAPDASAPRLGERERSGVCV